MPGFGAKSFGPGGGVSWPVSVLMMTINWLPSEFLSLVVDRFLGVTPLVGG